MLRKQLSHTFICQLIQALLELLGLHGVLIDDLLEYLRWKAWDAGEEEVLPFRQRISDLEITGVEQSHHIPRKGFLDHIFLPGQEAVGVAESDILIETDMVIEFIPFKSAWADPQERDAVAVFRVQVCVDLEDESAELVFLHIDVAQGGLPAPVPYTHLTLPTNREV